VTVALTVVGVGVADGVGVGDGAGRDAERDGDGAADGDPDGDGVATASARWCAGPDRAGTLPRGLPCGAALALVPPARTAEQLTRPQSLATRRPSGPFIIRNAPTASAAAPAPARATAYHR
jgi:hypothetical protein